MSNNKKKAVNGAKVALDRSVGKIDDRFYLMGMDASRDFQALKREGIKAVVVAAFDFVIEDEMFLSYKKEGITCYKTSLVDGRGNTFIDMLTALTILNMVYEKGYKIAICGHGAQSRSPLLLGVFKAIKEKKSLEDSVLEILDKKHDVCINASLIQFGYNFLFKFNLHKYKLEGIEKKK